MSIAFVYHYPYNLVNSFLLNLETTVLKGY